MKKPWIFWGVTVYFTISMIACSSQTQPAPTATLTLEPTYTPDPTLTATPTFTPTSTPTPLPTNTPKPTSTSSPTVRPTIALGDAQFIEEASFSFRPPIGYEVDVQGAQIGVFDKASTIIISIYGATSNPQDLSSEEIADEFLAAVFKAGEGEYTKGPASPVKIDEVEGLAYGVNGTLFGSTTQGQAIIVMPSNQQFLFGLGIANTERDPKRWENEGGPVFNALIQSITFSSSTSSSNSPCAIATISTYGFTQENPIKVGGGAFGGPSRERAYLDNLRGPKGEALTYERTGSVDFGDTILDIFEISGTGKVITLYIDEYAYTEPQAPVGFTCAGKFPLSAP